MGAALAGFVVSCSKKAEENPAPEPAATPTPAAAAASPAEAEADKIFLTRCTVCHGATGTGDGPGAAALEVKPRNYTDAAWQKTVTDDDLKNIIVKGGAGVGKNAAMPGNPDLEAKPDVVAGLVKKIRSFSK
jgi:mono/diheme cytochrome c family protein